MRLVLIGDGDSPHLLKWARALADQVELWAVSSRGFLPGFDAVLPPARRLALATRPKFEGGNLALAATLPRLLAWLRPLRPDWLHAHYLTSHASLALAARALGVKARVAGSAWGSDVLLTPERGPFWRGLTARLLAGCDLTTSDSAHMAQRMRALGAREVMTFPFGLEALPPAPAAGDRQPWTVFANRGLEALYAPERVLAQFARLAQARPEARLVVANDGALRGALQAQAERLGLGEQVRFIGRTDAAAQAEHYRAARWYFSLPRSDSVSVSVLEAMAHGALPVLSDLPANRELVRDGDNGLILAGEGLLEAGAFAGLAARAEAVAAANHAWVAREALFAPAVARFVARLRSV